jgi:hypothetical protein
MYRILLHGEFIQTVYKMLEPKDNKPSVVSKKIIIKTNRKIWRIIFEPAKDRDGAWRIKTSDELNNLTRNKNIFNYIKVQSLNSFGHVHRMAKDRMVKKLCEWKSSSKDYQEGQKLGGKIIKKKFKNYEKK